MPGGLVEGEPIDLCEGRAVSLVVCSILYLPDTTSFVACVSDVRLPDCHAPPQPVRSFHD
jgi:hypothetical protein